MNQNLFNALHDLGVIATQDDMSFVLAAIEKDKEEEARMAALEAVYCDKCHALDEVDCCCDSDEYNDTCELCGGQFVHHRQCVYADPMDYENCGFG